MPRGCSGCRSADFVGHPVLSFKSSEFARYTVKEAFGVCPRFSLVAVQSHVLRWEVHRSPELRGERMLKTAAVDQD